MFPDFPAHRGHQQPVQHIGRLTHGCWNILSGEGPELVGKMSVGLQARIGAILGVDDVHSFTLSGCRKELPVA